jgi:hypothetical protein
MADGEAWNDGTADCVEVIRNDVLPVSFEVAPGEGNRQTDFMDNSTRSNAMDPSPDAAGGSGEMEAAHPVSQFKWIGWSSLFLAIVQSVCTILVVLSGLRLLLGAAAFGAAIGVMKFADRRIHIDAVRIPMLTFALAGAVFNLVALWQVRRLRGRAASAWRQKEVSRSKFASERVQLALSVLTLVLLAVESFYHLRNTHHL